MSSHTETSDSIPLKSLHDIKNRSPTLTAGSDISDAENGNQMSTSPTPGYLPGAKISTTKRQFWTVLFGLNVGMFLAALDFNIVATAVPTITSEFLEYRNSSWIGTGFFVSFALVLPIYAKFGVMFGNRNMFIIGTLIFIVGSGLCGGASSMSMLVWARVVQGIGGGGIYGLVNVIVTDLVPLQDVGKYLSFSGLVWVIADVLGPLLGGAFSQYVTWRWCFYINLCISPVSLLITLFYLRLPAPHKTELKQKLLHFDYLGTLLLSGATVCLLLGISWGGNTYPWGDSRVIGSLVGAVILLALFIITQHIVTDPIISPTLFKNRTVVAICAAEFFYGANLLGMQYYVPQFFQLVFGDSAVMSGVGLLPMMLGLGIGNPVAAFVTGRYGVSLVNAIIGAILQVLMSGLITRWNAETTRAEAVITLIVLGMGLGASMSGLLLTAQVAVSGELVGIVTGLVIFVQTVGVNFGIAFYAAAYMNTLRAALERLGLAEGEVLVILEDVKKVQGMYGGEMRVRIVDVYAKSMMNGWWLMFACAAAVLVCAAAARQHKFQAANRQERG